MATTQQSDSRSRLLNAALKVVRSKGYTATRVEDLCAEAGVTKVSFFHHFKSKDDLVLAAVAHWDEVTGIGKYEEEFEPFYQTFVKDIWTLVLKLNQEPKFDPVSVPRTITHVFSWQLLLSNSSPQ
jgi:AcrR family transcriptional regulator